MIIIHTGLFLKKNEVNNQPVSLPYRDGIRVDSRQEVPYFVLGYRQDGRRGTGYPPRFYTRHLHRLTLYSSELYKP